MAVKFSIIIPTYNRGHLIRETVLTVINQDFRNYELIIVDDGSTDNTASVVKEIIQSEPTVSISYHLKENGERAAARNFGTRKAIGQYVSFFDSDDELYPNHLSVANEFIESHLGVEVFHQRYDIKNAARVKTSEGPIFKSPPNDELIKGNFLSCNGVFIRKDIALQNLFNEDRGLSAAEDWELWLRLSVQFPIHYINTITSSIINHEDRSVLIVNKEKQIKRMELLLHYVYQNPSITQKHNAVLYKLKASCYSYISLHLALTKAFRKDAIRYLFKSLMIKPSFVFEKRFFGILKNLI